MKRLLLFILPLVSVLAGCKYDDTQVWDEINAQKAKITALEGTVSSMNSNIGSLQSLITAVQQKVTVNAVTKTEDGYLIAFSDGNTARIKNGADGKDGVNGQNGADGKDGETPQIGVKEDTDGNYYWTVNGQWMKDASGKKVSTSHTPQVKIEDDQWMVSYDGGENWNKVEGQGPSATCIFETVTTDANNASFTLSDGTVIKVPLTEAAQKLQLVFNESVFAKMRDGELLSTAYTITAPEGAKVDIQTFESDGWTVTIRQADARSGRISIQAPAKVSPTKVLFLLTDDKGGSFIKIITIGLNESAKPTVQTEYSIDYQGGELIIPLVSSTAELGEGAGEWLQVVSVGDQVVLKVAGNESYDRRSAKVTLEDGTVVTVTQVTKNALILSKTVINIDGRRQKVAFVVNANVNVTANITEGSDWLSVSPKTRALAERIFTFTAKRNNTESERTATVVFTGAGLSGTCTVNQAVFTGDPSMDVTEAVATDEGEAIELQESLVVARTTDGFVVSDGSNYIFASGANPTKGDKVKFSSSVTTLNGLPALGSVSEFTTVSNGNTVNPSTTDITSKINSYSSEMPTAVKVKGDLIKDKSGNYSLIVKGSEKKVVIYKPHSSTGIDTYNGYNLTVRAIYYGEADSAINLIVVDFTNNGLTINEGDKVSVAQFINLANTELKLEVGPGLVVASASSGFLMEQDGAKLYVYGGKAKVGDNVTVKGKYSVYGDNNVPQMSSPTVTVNSSDNTVSHPTLTSDSDITSKFSSYSATTREYVTFTGKLTISGSNYNITVDGSSDKIIGSIVKPVENISSLNNGTVTVKGYYLYHKTASNGNTYIYFIATHVNDTALVGQSSSGGGGEGGGTVSGNVIDFSTLGIENGTQYNGNGDDKTVVQATDFKVCFGKGGNDGKYYNTGSGIRTYGNGYIRIESSKNIKKIVYTFDNATNNGAPTYPSGTAYTLAGGGSLSINGATATWTGSSKTVTLTRPEGSGHWRLQKVEVTF